MSTKKSHLLLGIGLCLTLALSAQCLTAPPVSSCTGTEPLVANGETINLSDSKWFYGANATFTNLLLRGGTLTVCGNLTLQNFTMDSGTIYVVNGGKLRIEGGSGLQLFGNCRIYNYGTLEVTRNLSLENHYASTLKPNILVNTANAYFNMQNQYFVINNPYSFFVNRGVADFHGIITDPGSVQGSVCLGNQSQTSMTVLYNKVKFSYSSPEGIACLSVSEFSQIWDTLTSSASIALCLGPKFKADSSCIPFGCKPNAWGPVQVFTKCNSCVALMVLPVKLGELSVQEIGTANRLDWKTDAVNTNFIFLIERSAEGRIFETIDTTKNQMLYYDHRPMQSSYYRVTCIDKQSGIKRSSNIVLMNREKVDALNVYPNPFKNIVSISLPARTNVRIQVMNVQGKIVYDKKNVSKIVMNGLPAGLYYFRIVTGAGVTIKKLIKMD